MKWSEMHQDEMERKHEDFPSMTYSEYSITTSEQEDDMDEIIKILTEFEDDSDKGFLSEAIMHKEKKKISPQKCNASGQVCGDSKPTKKTKQITAEEVETTLQTIRARFGSFNYEVKQAAEQCRNKVDELVQSFQVLEDCVDMKSPSEEIRKQRSWSKLHCLMSTGIPQVTALTRNDELTTLLCFNLFKALLREDLTSANVNVETQTNTLTPEEKDISSYIGGSIICKLKKRYTACRDAEGNKVLAKVIDGSRSEPKLSFPSLTSVKSRGGLIHLTSSGRTIFEQFEESFRQCFPKGVTEMSSDVFKEACISDPTSKGPLIDTDIQAGQEVFQDMIHLYFKIRSYSNLRNAMQKFLHKTKKSKTQKALRKTLKS